MMAIHRRLQRGVVLVRRQVQRQVLAAFGLRAQVRADAAQRNRGGLQRPHARPVAVVLRQLRVQVGQNLGRDGRVRLLGGGAGIGKLAIQQRTAVQRDVYAAQLRVNGRLRVRPVHRLDQGQVGVQHVLRQVNALVGAGRAARQARLGGEALARIDRQRLGRRADGAVARVQLDAVAGHDGIGTARGRVGEDAVTRFDGHRARRRVHILQRRPRAIAAVREVIQTDVVACFRAGVAVGPHHVERDRATQRDGVHVDLRAGARGHLPVHIARHDADFALHRDRCRLRGRHRFDMHRLAVANDQVARQRDVAIAANVDGVVGVAGAHEAQRDFLGSRHVEGEQLLLLLLDHLRQGRRLGAQPAAAAGVRAVVAHDDAGVELAVGHAEDRGIQRRATRGFQTVMLAVRAFDTASRVFHQRLRAAAFDRGGQQRVVQFAAGDQLLFQRIRHGIDAVIGDHRRHQHGARRLKHRDRAGLAGVLVRQPAQGVEVAEQVELLGGVDGGGGFARAPAHDPHHHLAGLGLVAQGQRLAVLQRAGGVAQARRALLAVAVVVHPDPGQGIHFTRRRLHRHKLVPHRVHDVVRALQLVQVFLAARGVDNFDPAAAVGADVDVARHQGVGRLVVDVHRRVTVGHNQVAIAHRHDLAGQRNAAARQADRVQDDGLRGVVETAGDGAVTVQRPVGAERHAADGIAVAVLQRLVLVAAERAVDLDVGVGQAALDLAVDVQRQRRNADRAQREDTRITRRRVVVHVLGEGVQLHVAPFQQHVLHRVADTGAGAAALQGVDDAGPAVIEQRGVSAGVEPPVALQAEIALGHNIQAHRLDRARHIDAAQRVDHRHLAQRVDHRAQQAQVHGRVRNHIGQRFVSAAIGPDLVQHAAERVRGPGVLDLADVDFGRVGP